MAKVVLNADEAMPPGLSNNTFVKEANPCSLPGMPCSGSGTSAVTKSTNADIRLFITYTSILSLCFRYVGDRSLKSLDHGGRNSLSLTL